MIIFYDKTTGDIVGTIEGRIHTPEQLNMWVGDKSKTKRLVINWKKVGDDFEPEIEDTQLIKDFENNTKNPFHYRVNSGKLERKN